MNKLYILLLLFLQNQINAQSFTLQYNSRYDGSNYQNELYANDTISIWEGMPDPGAADQTEELLIKYFLQNKIVLSDYVFQKKFYVEDTMHPMIWELLPTTKQILTYTCHSASTQFRGRSYIAYYTHSLPAKIGPWKFGGLPGAILEVSSSDQAYNFIATGLQVNDTFQTDIPSVDEEDTISWSDYCMRFINTADHYARYMQTVNQSPGGSAHLKIDRPEIIYPRAQTGIGIGAE